MNPVRRIPNHKTQARPFKATPPVTVTSLHRDQLRFKAAANVIKISPSNKILVSRKLSAGCKPLQPGFPTQMAKALQRLIPRRRRLLRPHLAISKPTLISLPPASHKTRHPTHIPPLPRKIIRRSGLPPPPSIRHPRSQLQPYRPLQLRRRFQIQFQPSRSFPVSAPFEAHPMPPALAALTFRLAGSRAGRPRPTQSRRSASKFKER